MRLIYFLVQFSSSDVIKSLHLLRLLEGKVVRAAKTVTIRPTVAG